MTEFLYYKGKELPVRVSFYALKHTKRETKKDVFDNFDLDMFEPLLFYSLKAGHKAEGIDLDIKREDVEFVLDEVLQDFMKLVKAFTKSFIGDEVKEETEETAKKKE